MHHPPQQIPAAIAWKLACRATVISTLDPKPWTLKPINPKLVGFGVEA